MSGGIEETSASFEARSAPRSYPSAGSGAKAREEYRWGNTTMQHRAPCPDDPADLSTAWASKLHGIPLSAPHCRFLRLFVVSDNSAQRENVPKATLARRSGFALIASSLPQSGRHVAVLAGQAAAASAFRDETTMPAPPGHFFGRERKAPRDAPHCIRGAL